MEEPTPAPQTESAPPPQTLMSLPARLMNMFVVPGEVFDEVKNAPTSAANWLAPALLVLILGWVAVSLMYSQPAIQQQMQEAQDQMIQKMVDKGMIQKEQAEKQQLSGGMQQKVAPYFGPVFQAFASPFLWGIILWIGARVFFKTRIELMKWVEVAGLSNTIVALGVIVHALLVIAMGDIFATASPGWFFKDKPMSPAYMFGSAADVFTLWSLGVCTIGLQRFAGTSLFRAGLWVFGIWATYNAAWRGLSLAVMKVVGLA